MASNTIPRYVKAASFGFLSGVLIHSGMLVPVWWLVVVVALPLFFFKNKFVWVACLACGLGFLRFDATLPHPNDALLAAEGGEAVVTGVVREAGPYRVIMDVAMIQNAAAKTRSRLSFPPGSGHVSVGQTVRVSCRPMALDLSDPKARFQARRGVFASCSGKTTVRLQAFAPPFFIPSILANWRSTLTARIRQVLPGDEGELLAGILYGERGLSKRMNDAFRMAGMTHLIAVSGSNITLVVALFVPLFLLLGYRRKTAILLSGFGILLFTLFVGAEASVVRAAIMGWLALLARFFGRKPNAGHLLLLAAAIMTFFDPWSLAFDAGFALSFLASWGLIALSPFLTERLKRIPEPFGLREITATTLSATVATTPYGLWAFQQSSLAGLITNLFAIPLIGLSMAWGAFAIFAGPYGKIFVWPGQGLLHAILFIAETANRFPWLAYSVSLPLWAMGAVYLVLVGVWIRIKGKNYPQHGEEDSKFPSLIHGFVRAF